VAVVLAAACSFDASRLRHRQLADSGASEADARDADATEVDALLDRAFDQDLGAQDSFVEVGADRANAMSEVATEAGSSTGDAADARADLPLGTDGAVDTGGAAGADGGDTDGAPGSDGATDTGGTDGSVSLPAGLVAWWKMNEAAGSATAVDSSGNGNNGTLTGLNAASAWTTGRTGGALKCDGSGGALVADSAGLDGIATGVTISAWVNRLSATTGFSAVLSRETGTTSGQYYWLGLSGDNAGFYGLSGVFSTTTVPIGTWTHLAATHDGTTARIYVNGSLVTSRASSNVFRADTSKLAICGNQNDTSGTITERWNGLLDDLQLYNRALTATEIANLAK
jgi:hypothetical protein